MAYGIESVQVTPDSVIISGEPSIFTLDGTVDLSIALFDSSDQRIPLDIAPTWKSSDRSVVRVTPTGTVIGLKPGRATITATVGSARGYSEVTVLPAADTGIIIAAHRGFSSVFPENTLVSIAGAFQRGADAVEIDVQLTVDDVPIVMHDATVNRTTNGIGAVRFMKFDAIRQLDACSTFGPTWSPCAVPTLQEALETARGHGLLILDLKGLYTNAALTSLIKLVRNEGMSQQVLFSSTDRQVLVHLRQTDSAIPLGFFFDSDIPLIRDITKLGRAVGMPREQTLLADPVATSALVRSASSEQVDIMAWTITSPEDAMALVALGVRGIMTDVPLDKETLR